MTLTADSATTAAFGGMASVVVRNYPGRSQSEAANMFAQEALVASRYGYLPVSQSWGEGRAGIKRVVLIGFGSLVWKPKGFLTVTYTRSGGAVVEPRTALIGGSLSDLERSDMVAVYSYRAAPWASDVTISETNLRSDGEVSFQISNRLDRQIAKVAAVVSWWDVTKPFRIASNPEIGTLEYLIPNEDKGSFVADREVTIPRVGAGDELIRVRPKHEPHLQTQARAAIYAITDPDGRWISAEQITPKMFMDWERQHRTAAEPEASEPDTKTCPMCAEDVKWAAKICRFCRYEFGD